MLVARAMCKQGHIIKPRCRVEIAHKSLHSKDNFFRGAAEIAVDFSEFGCFSDKNYGEPLGEPIKVCGFEKALSAGQLIDFGEPASPVMD